MPGSILIDGPLLWFSGYMSGYMSVGIAYHDIIFPTWEFNLLFGTPNVSFRRRFYKFPTGKH